MILVSFSKRLKIAAHKAAPLFLKTIGSLVNKTLSVLKPGKTPEEIRKTFNIKNDFTPEEEEQVSFVLLIFHVSWKKKMWVLGLALQFSDTEGQKWLKSIILVIILLLGSKYQSQALHSEWPNLNFTLLFYLEQAFCCSPRMSECFSKFAFLFYNRKLDHRWLASIFDHEQMHSKNCLLDTWKKHFSSLLELFC